MVTMATTVSNSCQSDLHDSFCTVESDVRKNSHTTKLPKEVHHYAKTLKTEKVSFSGAPEKYIPLQK